jgi:hypothetical protein
MEFKNAKAKPSPPARQHKIEICPLQGPRATLPLATTRISPHLHCLQEAIATLQPIPDTIPLHTEKSDSHAMGRIQACSIYPWRTSEILEKALAIATEMITELESDSS